MYKYGIIETEARGKQNRDVVLTWLFEENGTLSIFGAGMLPDYKDGQDRPWQEYADQVTALVVDDGITTIGEGAFKYCDAMTAIALPSSVTAIETAAFYSAMSLAAIDIPEGVLRIGDEAFLHCDTLTRVDLPKGLQELGRGVFSYCDGLETTH